jgi:ketopantoate reductase
MSTDRKCFGNRAKTSKLTTFVKGGELMKNPVVIIGVGEMGGVFARGILRVGHPVVPVTRTSNMQEVAQAYPQPQLVLVSVAENDLHTALTQLPATWHARVGLLQNELLPRDWQRHHLTDPTVISVWFEKKKGQDAKVLIPSPVYGPQAGLLVAALAAVDIPAVTLNSDEELCYELVRKNVYILTTNICGLVTGSNVEHLWQHHQELAREVANEVIDIQEWLTDCTFDREQLIAGMLEGIEGDPAHMCMGRSAPARLKRALRYADDAKLPVPRLREIFAQQT